MSTAELAAAAPPPGSAAPSPSPRPSQRATPTPHTPTNNGAHAPEEDGDGLNNDEMESEADDSRTKLENFKYYTSLILGTLCIVCIFAFLFLVPFVLDPAISTLRYVKKLSLTM